MTDEYTKQCLIDFYSYETRYRGWYHYPFPVPLEVPYKPFVWSEPKPVIDDGYVPSFLERLGGRKKKTDKVGDHPDLGELIPERKERNEDFCILKLSFRVRPEITKVVSQEFLNVLSLCRDSLSFEIVGTGREIWIQLTCSEYDLGRVEGHLFAFFPDAVIQEIPSIYESLPYVPVEDNRIMIADFGLESESMLPIHRSTDFRLDPLAFIITQFEQLRTGSVAVLQILFQGVHTPLSQDLLGLVQNEKGGSVFPENPEMLLGTREKISSPLFSCVVRVACQGADTTHSKYFAQELIKSIEFQSHSGENRLIALPNKGYDYMAHVVNVFHRTSNRHGMILNTDELLGFVHYPNNTVISAKLGGVNRACKVAPLSVRNNPYHLGINRVGNEEVFVTLNDEQRLSHTHVIGGTGMGKSTLLSNMFLQDISMGLGAVMFDPHGDIIDDILLRIPHHRKDDVILLDPSDTDFPLGFNLLHAESEAERLVLSSDLVLAFRKYASAWGDRMTSVLSNAIDTFLESDQGGTLIELKRFLLEKTFREKFLESVSDPQLQYYWKHDYSLVSRSSLSPLLTRIDTFLRPKIIRLMFAQRTGLDLADIVNGNKILLVKLSQGLIGKSNAHLLGTLLVSKLSQVALGRQALRKEDRTPFYVYMDEFQNLMTDSISDMLSGVRKYAIGLVLAHQEMKQLSRDPELEESMISNPNIRICFRLGDTDAKTMERGFSGFDMNDLQSLERGKAIMRVGGASSDFNIAFPKPISVPEYGDEMKNYIVEETRRKYAQPKDEVEKILFDLLPSQNGAQTDQTEKEPIQPQAQTESSNEINQETFDTSSEQIREEAKKERLEREHEKLKVSLGRFAQECGFRIVHEEATESGGRIDLTLHSEKNKIACEISITNTAEYEVQNIQKCFDAGYKIVCVISPDDGHLKAIEKKAREVLSESEIQNVKFLDPLSFESYLKKFTPKRKAKEKIVKGYRVKIKYSDDDSGSSKEAQETIAKTMIESIKKKRKK